MPKKMHLGFDFSYNHLGGRWRLPGGWDTHTFPDMEMFDHVARTAERACLDMLFSGDGTGVPDTWRGSREAAVEWGINFPRQDLSPQMVAMSRVTKHIGFGITYSSSFMHPYYLARFMNSMDHVTNGRVAMNLVASTRPADFANYGYDGLMDHGDRYERMEEFVDVCRKLWDAIEPDALIWDRETGRVAEPSKVHPMSHKGKFFKVEGPLNSPPSPQGRPVIVQAGGSPRGIRASAYVADVIFGPDMALDAQVKHRAALDAVLPEFGRDPAKVGILWQTPIVVAETEREAIARRESLLTVIPPEAIGSFLSYNTGYDLSTLPQRFKLSELQAEIVAKNGSPMGILFDLAHKLGKDAELTRDEFLEYGAHFATAYDKTVAGTGKQMADYLENAFIETGERGGFMLGHTVALRHDLAGIVDHLVPELQRRGRFRTEYTGKTLRENLEVE